MIVVQMKHSGLVFAEHTTLQMTFALSHEYSRYYVEEAMMTVEKAIKADDGHWVSHVCTVLVDKKGT